MKRNNITLCLLLAGMILVSAACDSAGAIDKDNSGETTASGTTASADTTLPDDTSDGKSDAATDADEENATAFVFSDDSVKVTEGKYTGYKVDGTSLTINEPGTYIISGSSSDGSVKVKKGTTGVTLILRDLDLSSESTAPIVCAKSSEVNIIVSGANSLADATLNNADENTDNADAENAVMKFKDGSDVVISGSGTLKLTANAKNGIKSGESTETEGEASLTIKDLTLIIDAPINDGINAGATLNVLSGNITVSAGDDGIHSDATLNIGSDPTSPSPTIVIEQSYEGLEGATVNICSGDITIHSSDDCVNAANPDLSGYSYSINISGGRITADTTTGDGFDSNGAMNISGGDIVVWTANAADNQPLDADGTITISGGTILAAGGGAGMGMNIDASQSYLTFGQSSGFGGFRGFGSSGSTVKSGAEIVITDADRNEIYSGDALTNANWFFFSSPELSDGGSYKLTSGGSEIGTAEAKSGTENGNRFNGGGFNGGGFRPGKNGGTDMTPPEGSDGGMPELPGDFDGDMPEMPGNSDGNRPEMPGNFDGERPGLPEDFDGELPEGFENMTPPDGFDGEMPTRPDGSGMTPPDMSGRTQSGSGGKGNAGKADTGSDAADGTV